MEEQQTARTTLHAFEAIVQSSDDAILSKDPDGFITSWNPGAQRMYGYTPEEAIGQRISILIPKHRAGEEREVLARIMAGDNIDHYETERVTKEGRQIAVSLSVSPIRDETGEIVRAAVIARDITAQRRSRELASRLQAVTAALSREITPSGTVDVLLEEVVAALGAAAGALGLVDEDGERIEITGSSGYAAEAIERFRDFGLDEALPMSAAVREGRPIWITTSAELEEQFPGVGGAGSRFEALAVLPLSVAGKPFGAISLSFTEPREFDTEEQVFLTAAVQQAAHALDRARLYEAERLSAERLSFLAEASELLSASLNPEEILWRLADLVVPRVSGWCSIELLDEEGGLRNVAVVHLDPEKVKFANQMRDRYPFEMSDEIGVAQVIRSGRSELYEEIPEALVAGFARDEEHLRLLTELAVVSMMIVPLKARGRVLGAITFVASESGRHFDTADLLFAEDVARRAALAIDNAMLYKREHEAAITLQRSLLPQELPSVEGVEFAVHYEPGGVGLEVGGDWYEVETLDDGRLGLTIGDVAGRGIRAAAVMGRARAAMRAYLLDGHPPAEAIERLDRVLKGSENPEMITAFHLQFDPASSRAEYVRAGHPPALLRLAGGEVVELSGAGTPPLGILEDIEYRSHAVELPPGSLLLLYTDGLIERRGNDLEAALERLKRALAEQTGGPEECLRALADEFRTEEVPDDVAMLAMRIGAGAEG